MLRQHRCVGEAGLSTHGDNETQVGHKRVIRVQTGGGGRKTETDPTAPLFLDHPFYK